MHRLIKVQQQLITDAAAVGSISTGAFAWLANVNEILQFISLVISIALGAYAIHRILKKDDEK